MGNVSDRQIQVLQDPRIYLQTDLPKFIYEDRIGNGKFMKSYLMKIDDTAVAVKVYLKPADDDVDKYAVILTRLWQTLSPSRHPYLLPYQMWIKSSARISRPQMAPNFLIRQYFPFNLYDRLSTRPFLTDMEKLWLIYQLMRAVEACHDEGVSHGDIKPENVMVTSWNWVVLTDFAPFKPVFIPNDNPTDFHYFFDSMGRRRCSLAPERFTGSGRSETGGEVSTKNLLPSMDIFSLGCTVAEVLLDGEPLLDLPSMLRYKSASEDPSSGEPSASLLTDPDSPAIQTINRIKDPRMRQAIAIMTCRDPTKRESVRVCRTGLEECQVFPAFFTGSLYDFFLKLHSQGTTPDDKIALICKNYATLMENIADCVDEEGNKFFAHMLCGVFSGSEDENKDSEGVQQQTALDRTVDIVSARQRSLTSVSGIANTKPLKSSTVRFTSGNTVKSKLDEAVGSEQSSSSSESMLRRSLQQHAKAPSSRAPRDDEAVMELILQFEKLIDDAREQSQRSGVAASISKSSSDESKKGEGKTTSATANQKGSESQTHSRLKSYVSMVSAVRGDGSRLFDVDEAQEASPDTESDDLSSRMHHQPSSLSQHVENAGAILEENKSRSQRKASEAVSGGLLLVIQVICSTVRYLRHPQSRICSLMLLSRMGALCTDTVILERIIPFVMLHIEDPIAVVRATSIRCLRTLLNSVTEISHVDANIFKEFIFPALDNVMNKDSEAIVRIAFAESIGRFAETSMRFLDAARFIHQNKCISATSAEGGLEADPASVLVEGSYDASVAALHNHVSKWIRDLVLDGNIGMMSDGSKNEARRQHSNGSHSAVVKRAILEDVVRLCVFFGKQEKIMDLFAQLLAYVNHQDWDLDWELRNAFCVKIPLVCTFLGPSITSECILPFLEKARVDIHEIVVASAVRCIWTLIEMRLLSKPLVVDVLAKTVPLLLHPSLAIRDNAIGMIAGASKLFGVTDSYVYLLPHIRPILRCELIGLEITRRSLNESLMAPLQRRVYQKAVRDWPQVLTQSSTGEQSPRGRTDSMSQSILNDSSAVDVSGVLVETDMAASSLGETSKLEESEGAGALSPTSSLTASEAHAKAANTASGMAEEDISKLLFLKEYIDMAIKENPSRSSQWKGINTAATSRRSTIRRQSTASFRSNSPMSLDSLLDLFSYQTLITLGDHHVHSLYVPHEKYSLQRAIPDSIRTTIVDADLRTKDMTWVKAVYGIDIQQSGTNGTAGAAGTGNYYDSDTMAYSTTAQNRPTAMAVTPPNQALRRTASRISTLPAEGVLGAGGAMSADQLQVMKGAEVSLHELYNIRRKIKALNIPPLSPDFGSLVQPSDGRPYSMFVEPLDLAHSGDAQSGQLWRPKENTVVSTLFEHTGAVNRIAIAQDQTFFVSASSDGTAKVWQVKGTERNAFPRSVETYNKHTGRVVDAAIIENSHSVATCSDSGAVHVWRVDLGNVGGKRAHAHYSPAQQNPDASPPSTTRQASSTVWGSSTIKTLSHDEGPVLAVQHFTGDVASVLTYVSRKGLVHGWDLRCSQEAFLYNIRPELGYPMSMVCSPDRNWICVGTSQGYIGLWDIRYNVMSKLWRHSSASAIHRLACAKSSPNVQSTREGVLASSEGAYVFAAAGNNEAAVWGIPEGGECLKCFRSVSMSSARGAMAPLPYLHDVAIPSHPLAPFTGKHVQYVNRSSIDVSSAAVRALVGRVSYSSASYLVTAGTDRSIRYWDFTTPSRCFTVSGLEAAQPKPVYETPPSPALRGKLFVCYDSAVPSVKATLQSQLPLREYRGTLPPISNYKDAILDLKTVDLPIKMMISASRDGEIKLWR